MGHVYKRDKTYWIKYYRNGKPYYESTRSKKEADAKRLLKKREGEIADGRRPGVYFERTTFNELAEGFLSDRRYRGGENSVKDALVRLSNLRPFFGDRRAVEINTASIKQYIEQRQAAGAKNSIINRELAALGRMFNLGKQETPPKVHERPYIPMLEENNVKQGFFEPVMFEPFLDALPSYLRGFANFGYFTGWRYQEVAGLTWDRVDMENRTIRLNRGETKNKEGRVMFMEDDVFVVVLQQQTIKKDGCPFVFHKDGERIKDFRGVWNKACRETGLGQGYSDKIYQARCKKKDIEPLPLGPTFHDLRRTAVREMTRAGVSRRVAMQRSGHKTESVFNRYDIVDDKDLKAAAEKLQDFRNGYKNGYNSENQSPEALQAFLFLSILSATCDSNRPIKKTESHRN